MADSAHDRFLAAVTDAGLTARRIECPQCHGRRSVDGLTDCCFCGGSGSVYAIERQNDRPAEPERERPFHCGSQFVDFESVNCCRCAKCSEDATTEYVWGECELHDALTEACIGDGLVDVELLRRHGYDGVARSYGWKCSQRVAAIGDTYQRIVADTVTCPTCPHDGTCTEDYAAGCGAYAGERERKDGAA